MLKPYSIKSRYRLPYEYDFLDPILKPMSVSLHFNGHLMNYYDDLEQELAKHDASVGEYANNLAELARFSFGKPHLGRIFYDTGQIINHIHFFDTFVFQELDKSVVNKVREAFKSPANLLTEMYQQARSLFGPGWLWVILDNNNTVRLISTPNAFTIENLDYINQVLLCIDLWEHAYYLDFYQDAPNYLGKIFEKTNLYQHLK